MKAIVTAVHKSKSHTFRKLSAEEITLRKGLGVDGDAHMGITVKHRSRVKADPTQPNLRQIHLIHSELFVEVAEKGFRVHPGEMGENITTAGLNLLALPRDTVLKIGPTATVQITGLRNPCKQIDNFQEGLLSAVLDKDETGNLNRKAGIMGIVLESGPVNVGDEIAVELPPEPHLKLERV